MVFANVAPLGILSRSLPPLATPAAPFSTTLSTPAFRNPVATVAGEHFSSRQHAVVCI